MGKDEPKGMLSLLFRYSLFLLVFILQGYWGFFDAGSIVKFLPGFDGPLPFELETGYIGVDESEDVQLFYYFIKSESNPEEDPLLLWLTGGPGCTSFSGLVYEIEPINFEPVQYHRSLPKLLVNPHSWTKVASIIFVDLPVGTGFSYATTSKASNSTELQACNQAYEFLRNWLVDHPEFVSNPVYVGGDSYSGYTVPVVTQLISDGIDVGIVPRIDLKGYILRNPTTSPADGNYMIQFAHGMGLISDELYKSLLETCAGKYHDIDPSNALCKLNMQTFNLLLSNINHAHVLEPRCPFAAPNPSNLLGGTRSLYEMFHQKLQDLKHHELVSPFKCRADGYRLAYYWANDKIVQEAPLHVRKGALTSGKDAHLMCRSLSPTRIASHIMQTSVLKVTDLLYTVKFLPGFHGPLPFELETGYIGVGESEEVQLFYYFIKSESINPEKDPLFLWLTGGPGYSALSELVYEIGPFTMKAVEYDGSLPKLQLNPYSWTKVATIIFLDLPGFSYATTVEASHFSDHQESDHAYEFLRKWLLDHPEFILNPEFISNPFYVSGDSYSSITVPIITQLISNGNDVGIEPRIALKGYLLGNPGTSIVDLNYRVPFAHGMGLISDELYESLKESCKGEYQRIDPSNEPCLQNVQPFDQLLSDITNAQILEPHCPLYTSKPKPKPKPKSNKSSLYEMFLSKIFDDELKIIREPISAFECRFDSYWRLRNWANDYTVQEALHVRKGTIKKWQRCNRDNLNFTNTVMDSRPYHANLSIFGYRSLIYSGDHDFFIPFLATQAWIRALNYPIIDDWRPWLFQAQVAGYTRTYANEMTFATVKGGGHTAPEYKPPECKVMFER